MTALNQADFNLSKLEPAARRHVQGLREEAPLAIPEMTLAAARALMRDGQTTAMEAPSVDARTEEIAGVRVWVVRPAGCEGDLPVILYLHGGGWVLGAPETHARIAQRIASMAGACVVVPDYALAPEHPYPAALDQCYAIAKQLALVLPGSGLDGRFLAVAGDSAGGNLAAAVALRAAESREIKFQLQALLCPALQVGTTTLSYQQYGFGSNLTADAMQWFWKQYVPDATLWALPTVSPLQASQAALARVAPAWIVTAGCDVLRDEAEQYGERLIEAGNEATVLRCEGTIHNFLIIDDLQDSGPAVAATAALGQALWNALHPSGTGSMAESLEIRKAQ